MLDKIMMVNDNDHSNTTSVVIVLVIQYKNMIPEMEHDPRNGP